MLLLHVEATVVQGHMALGFHLDVYKLLEEACTSVYIYILNFAICMLCMTLFVNNFKCIYIYTHTYICIYIYIYVIAPI